MILIYIIQVVRESFIEGRSWVHKMNENFVQIKYLRYLIKYKVPMLKGGAYVLHRLYGTKLLNLLYI